jgi:hypothetical protein
VRLVGFIKEHNDIEDSFPIKSYLSDDSLSESEVSSVINYLERGDIVLAWMGVFLDVETQDYIAPDCYYSDGEWVWPAYLSHYLKKYSNLKLPESFLSKALVQQKYGPITTNLVAIEKQLSEKLMNRRV